MAGCYVGDRRDSVLGGAGGLFSISSGARFGIMWAMSHRERAAFGAIIVPRAPTLGSRVAACTGGMSLYTY